MSNADLITWFLGVVLSLISVNQGYALFVKVRAEARKLGLESHKISLETIEQLWASIGRLETRVNEEIALRQALQNRIYLLESILRAHNIPIPPAEEVQKEQEITRPGLRPGLGGMFGVNKR